MAPSPLLHSHSCFLPQNCLFIQYFQCMQNLMFLLYSPDKGQWKGNLTVPLFESQFQSWILHSQLKNMPQWTLSLKQKDSFGKYVTTGSVCKWREGGSEGGSQGGKEARKQGGGGKPSSRRDLSPRLLLTASLKLQLLIRPPRPTQVRSIHTCLVFPSIFLQTKSKLPFPV